MVNVFLMLQSMLGHSIAMYVVFDMFFNGFRRKFQARYPNVHKQVSVSATHAFSMQPTNLATLGCG